MIDGRNLTSAIPSGPLPASRNVAWSRSMNCATRSASTSTSWTGSENSVLKS
jgi:hypothetical protein